MAAILISKMAAILISKIAVYIIIMDIKVSEAHFSGYTYIIGVIETFKLLTARFGVVALNNSKQLSMITFWINLGLKYGCQQKHAFLSISKEYMNYL